MRICSAFISWLFACTLLAQSMPALPERAGDHVRYYSMIETPRGYVSGVCILHHDGEVLSGAIVNEFGVSALQFTYNVRRDKVKIESAAPMLDHWYIKRVLRRDLREWLHLMRCGQYTYRNEKRHITYSMSALTAETKETDEEERDNKP